MEKQTLYTGRYKELDFLRTIATVAVVAIHVSVVFLSGQGLDNASLVWGIVLNQVGRFSVPVFLFVSGVLAFHSASRMNLRDLLQKRSTELLVPYIVWTLLGLAIAPSLSLKTLISAVLMGQGTFYQLYYIPLLFQMYLLLPIIRWIALKAWKLVIVFILSIVLFSAYQIAYLGFIPVPGFLPPAYLQKLIQAGFPFWVLYFTLGYFAGKNYHQLLLKLDVQPPKKIIILFLAGLMGLGADYYFNWRMTGLISGPLYDFYRPSVILYSFGWIVLLLKIGRKVRSDLIARIHRNSFGIYLSHLAVIMVLAKAGSGYFFKSGWGVTAGLVITLAVSFLISLGLQATPLGGIFLGKVYAKKPGAIKALKGGI